MFGSHRGKPTPRRRQMDDADKRAKNQPQTWTISSKKMPEKAGADRPRRKVTSKLCG